MADQFIMVDEATCAVCPALAEALVVVEETVQALEEGHHTMHTIARARQFLRKYRKVTGA